MTVDVFQRMNAEYELRTAKIRTLVREVEDAAGRLASEWPFVEIQSTQRHLSFPRGRRRPMERWPDGPGIAGQLQQWDIARGNALRLWSELTDSERDGLDPPWDPFASD